MESIDKKSKNESNASAKVLKLSENESKDPSKDPKKEPEGPAEDKPKKGKGGILHMKFADAFRFDQKKSKLPEPRCDIRVYLSTDKKTKIIFSVDEHNVARDRTIAYVVDEMASYRRQHLEYNPSFCDWTHGDFRECAKLWYSETEVVERPKPFAFFGDPEPTYHRIPFHIDVNKQRHTDIKPTPKCDDLMRRMHNSDAVRAYIASLLIEASYLQQYLYIYGDGGDGKGALLRALKRLFGAAAYTKQRGPRIDDKHYGVSFDGKRLVAFTDSRDPAVVRADYVMALTGDDGLEVEPKFGHGFNIPPYCKLIFLSNVHPLLENQLSEIRRLIYAWMDPRPTGKDGLCIDDPIGYEAGLWSEMEDFIKQCLNVYHELCPDHGKIPQSPAAIEAVKMLTAGREADNYREFFEDQFGLDLPEEGEQWESKKFVRVAVFNSILRKEFRDTKKRTAFKKWIADTHGIVTKGGGVKKHIAGSDKPRVYFGMFVI